MIQTEKDNSVIQQERDWSKVLSELTTKRQAAEQQANRLRAQKQDLALEAGMGSTDARKKLDRVNAELVRVALEIDDLGAAVTRAEAERQRVEQDFKGRSEIERRDQIRDQAKQYLAAITEVDDAMLLLAKRFSTDQQILSRAQALMTGPERQSLQQLSSTWGPTLAAATAGLGNYLELGPRASNITHRQSLEAFTRPFLDRWLEERVR